MTNLASFVTVFINTTIIDGWYLPRHLFKKIAFYIIDCHFVSQKCYVATSSTSIVFTKKTLEIWFIIL